MLDPDQLLTTTERRTERRSCLMLGLALGSLLRQDWRTSTRSGSTPSLGKLILCSGFRMACSSVADP